MNSDLGEQRKYIQHSATIVDGHQHHLGYLCFVKREVVISNRAAESLQRIVTGIGKYSLVSAEDTRRQLLSVMRKLAITPEHKTRKAKFATLTGDYRSILEGGSRVYYKTEKHRIMVLDIILEKPTENR